MKRILLVVVALFVVSLIAVPAVWAQATGTGVIRSLDGTGTAGTLYVLSVSGPVGQEVVPGTRLAISDNNLVFTGIRAGDKVSFLFQNPGPIGLEATGLSLMATGTSITTSVFVGIDITSDFEGNLVVNSGDVLTIKNSAMVDGNIKVHGGGVLIVTDSAFVHGNIKGENGGDILIDQAGVDGNVELKKDEDFAGNLAISQATIDGNVKVDRNLFLGMELSTVDGNVECRKTTLFGVLDSIVDGNIHAKDCDLVAYFGNTVDGDLHAHKVNSEVIVIGNTVDGNINIKEAPLCTESGNTVTKTNSGCPPPPEAALGKTLIE